MFFCHDDMTFEHFFHDLLLCTVYSFFPLLRNTLYSFLFSHFVDLSEMLRRPLCVPELLYFRVKKRDRKTTLMKQMSSVLHVFLTVSQINWIIKIVKKNLIQNLLGESDCSLGGFKRRTSMLITRCMFAAMPKNKKFSKCTQQTKANRR